MENRAVLLARFISVGSLLGLTAPSRLETGLTRY